LDKVYHDIGGSWPKPPPYTVIKDFPEGQIALIDHGNIVGIALSFQAIINVSVKPAIPTSPT